MDDAARSGYNAGRTSVLFLHMNARIIFIIGSIVIMAAAGTFFFARGKVDKNAVNAPEGRDIEIPYTTEEGAMSEDLPIPLSEEELNEIIPAGAPDGTSGAAPVTTPSTEPIPTTSSVEEERFVVGLKDTKEQVAANLAEKGFVESADAFLSAFEKKGGTIAPGGYHLSKGMTVEQTAVVLQGSPYMKWVVIPEGLRKEETAEILAKALGWSAETVQKWITTYSSMKYDNVEGVYFPDTYLLPVNESPLATTNRMLAKFNEKFSSYLPQFASQNIKWTTGLTLASIVQREAASDADMPLIAGILWNRLEENMTLNADATLQYVRGNTGKGWWAPITVADKKIDSPYNTYLYKGLPPHPIASPGIAAIEAVLKPAETECLYYLHDAQKVTHCAVTYEEHLDNIEKYLK